MKRGYRMPLAAIMALHSFCLAEGLGADAAGLQSSEPTTVVEQHPVMGCGTYSVHREKVRVRNRPDLDSAIVTELSRGDLICALGETGDFLRITPPLGLRGYIFRSYVLDGVVEAHNVNVRLGPSLDSPILGRVAQGTRVHGTSAGEQGKWLEIDVPESCACYIAKELMHFEGGAELYAEKAPRQAKARGLLAEAEGLVSRVLDLPYEEMRLEQVVGVLETLTQEYADCTLQAARAHALLERLQQDYVSKKVAYLQGEDAPVLEMSAECLASLEQIGEAHPLQMTDKMRMWEPVERGLVEGWLALNQGQTPQDFYLEEQRSAQELVGSLEVCEYGGKQHPGDYLLKRGSLTVAFLYSTAVNLLESCGQQVKVIASPRPNHHYAFPAFFVHAVDRAEEER